MNDTTTKRSIIGVPLDLLTRARDGQTLTDRWWVVQAGYALFYPLGRRGWSPQSNSDRRVTDDLASRLYPGAVVEFVPIAYLGPWSDDDGFTLTRELLAAAADRAALTEEQQR